MRVNTVDFDKARCERDGRWAETFHVNHGDFFHTYVIHCGNVGMPADYSQPFDTLQELEVAMRNFNDLRGWRIGE